MREGLFSPGCAYMRDKVVIEAVYSAELKMVQMAISDEHRGMYLELGAELTSDMPLLSGTRMVDGAFIPWAPKVEPAHWIYLLRLFMWGIDQSRDQLGTSQAPEFTITMTPEVALGQLTEDVGVTFGMSCLWEAAPMLTLFGDCSCPDWADEFRGQCSVVAAPAA